MPKKMRYDSQAMLVLAADLLPSARDLQSKREAAGDTANAFDQKLPKSRVFELAQINVLPDDYRQSTSRLIVFGHGDAGSTIIGSATVGGQTWTPEQLHTLLKNWMSTPGYMPPRVQRISLHMCYGGGNRGAVPVAVSSGKTAQFVVPPSRSFAQKFASMAGSLTIDVTARTDVTNIVTTTQGGAFVNAQRNVGGRHQAEGDKFVFTTVAGSTPDSPHEATRSAVWT